MICSYTVVLYCSYTVVLIFQSVKQKRNGLYNKLEYLPVSHVVLEYREVHPHQENPKLIKSKVE